MAASLTRRQMLLRSGLALGGAILAVRVGNDGKLILEAEASSREALRMMWNENPYGPSEVARAAMEKAFHEAKWYPDAVFDEMRSVIAEQVGLTRDHILLGTGSTEILQVVVLGTDMRGGEVISADPTFQVLNSYAENIGGTVRRVPVDADLRLDLDAMGKEVNANTRLIYVCNPNNPTGTIVPDAELRPFCEEMSRRALVVVDEAYHEYVEHPGYRSLVDLVRDGRNIIVTRTASKIHGLAGLRVGFGIAQPKLVKRLENRLTGTMNIMGLRAAIASYRDPKFQAYCFDKNKESKSIVYRTLRELNCRYVESETNFIFFETGIPIETVQQGMEDRGIRVGRPFPPYLKWCRLSMTKPDEMKTFSEALKGIMA
ncbi:MAG: aminotransferase class I/II-fold pyridoxal phosphate-dependent enzyme [Deltaproteobacteria bacterium]|jgi:histidinol-phosphate aminotransferase|nr:aminotransferase class I/II-fold pyridoxal phosphate-dependent enzyme [Deltaproteobacteria bacterium]